MRRTRQGELLFRTWGGKRKGAGRRAAGARPRVSHQRRPETSARHPVLVTTRVVPEVARLRSEDAYRAVQGALGVTLKRTYAEKAFRICQISIQGTHLHMLIETDDREALSRGMQGFLVSCAKRLNAAAQRKGRVFADRYHASPLATPSQVRNAIRYVLCNWRKHGEDRGDRRRLDPMSSANMLPDWAPASIPITPGAPILPVCLPRTWLLRTGWRKAGPISPWERPGPAP
jgi:putative transposase